VSLSIEYERFTCALLSAFSPFSEVTCSAEKRRDGSSGVAGEIVIGGGRSFDVEVRGDSLSECRTSCADFSCTVCEDRTSSDRDFRFISPACLPPSVDGLAAFLQRL